MKVLLISHTSQSQTEGQPKAALLGQLPGIDLTLLVPNRWKHYGKWRAAEPAISNSFRYLPSKVRLPWAGPAQFYLHHYPDLPNILKEFQPDIIDLWEEPWALVSAQACRLRAKLCPSAKIISETEQNICKTLPLPFEKCRAYTLARADHAVARNAQAVEVLRAKGYTGPATIVPNGVDSELFRPMDKSQCRAELGVQGFVVGYVGRLVEEKGILDLVHALPRCPVDVNLLLIGAGPLEPIILATAAQLNVAQRVRILPARPLAQLPQAMNALDLLALPSHTTSRWKEQFGRVLIEANACGTPVIGSDSGAIPDVIGQAGIVFPERNPEAIAQTITLLHADRSRLSELAAAARPQVEARYTWARVARHMYDIYHTITATSPLASSSAAISALGALS